MFYKCPFVPSGKYSPEHYEQFDVDIAIEWLIIYGYLLAITNIFVNKM